MVVIHLKDDIGSEGGFLFETTVDTPNDALIENLASIHNLRLQAIHLAELIKGFCSTVAKTKDEVRNEVREFFFFFLYEFNTDLTRCCFV